ncbi:hypothetical protein ABZ348_31070 [Streptomyces sp. NPDC005963]|uniref:hypothetical protein n=1 Tax=Streptomyces sp. NPDC005963 TaxID=3156721 RepID=UPI0033E3D50C
MFVSLAKTPRSISYGRMRSSVLNGLRRNNLLALSLEFGERQYLADVKRFEAHRTTILDVA